MKLIRLVILGIIIFSAITAILNRGHQAAIDVNNTGLDAYNKGDTATAIADFDQGHRL